MSTEQEVALQRRRVKAAHHRLVTKPSSQLKHVLDSGDARQMKQLKQSLTNKPHILSRLDDKLIDLVPDKQLEEEVQQADFIKEEITLTIISLDDGMESLLSHRPPRESTNLPDYQK